MIIITSSEYISSSLESEFGKIPQSFLPLQNKRLFVHQIDFLRKSFGDTEDIYLTLPSDFEILDFDNNYLVNELGINIVPVSISSLGQSLIHVLNRIDRFDEPIRILWGDTLFLDNENILHDNYDLVSIGIPFDTDYDDFLLVYTGYFSFSNQQLLIKLIEDASYDFISGVRLYNNVIQLTNFFIKKWLDFSNLDAFYRARTQFTTERSFNNLEISKYSVKKFSTNNKKILGEVDWYLNIPNSLKSYVPQVYDFGLNDEAFYKIEYFYLNSLSDLYVFGKNSFNVWKNILDACNKYIIDESVIKSNDNNVLGLYDIKTKKRLFSYCEKYGIDINHEWVLNGKIIPSLSDILDNISIDCIDSKFFSVMHGDFCFSNIFYDFNTNSVKVIDPRGLIGNKETIYGDYRYDIAKLAHSCIGLYDYIIAGLFDYKENDKYNIEFKIHQDNIILNKVQEYFVGMKFNGYTLDELSTYKIMMHLFLSMLSLHLDNERRHKGLLANALRLYNEYIKYE